MVLWSTLKSTVLAVAAVLNLHNETVCYTDYGIGCFSNETPFTNAAGKLPESPEAVGVSFLLHTRHNKNIYELLTNDAIDIKRSHFNETKETKFIIHGYRDDGRETWVTNMKDALLDKEDVNVISVDWERGADKENYNQAAANTRVVGALIAQFITALKKTTNIRLSDIHMIGHSLGAHIAGYAGEIVKGIGRITGLDPAGLCFGGRDPEVRLDRTDADYVDVIHTDGQPITSLGFGTSTRMGHADYYPNGGKNQPGCKSPGKHIFKLITGKFKLFRKGIGCDHARSRELYIESIKSDCRFLSYPCDSMELFEKGLCPCNGYCSPMGYPSNFGRPMGTFYLTTTEAEPFCKGNIV